MNDDLFRAFETLFDAYPLAVQPVTFDGTQDRMVLVGRDKTFCVLHRVLNGEPLPFFTLRPWRSGKNGVVVDSAGAVEVQGDGIPGGDPARWTATGVPFPRDGSLFGWRRGADITALVVTYAEDDGDGADTEPTWSAMPRADVPGSRWPPFAGQDFAGSGFWDHYRAGRVVNLAPVVAASPRTAFWVTRAAPGWSCCAVTRDLAGTGGQWHLGRGVFAYSEVLRGGLPVPDANTLAADPGAVDLAPQFA